MKLLLDTNILIDLIACRKPYVEPIRKLCAASVFGDVQLWVNTLSFADAFYVLRKSASEPAVKQALLASLEFILPCGTYAADLKPALESDWPDIEDYLIVAASKHIKADCFVTRDVDLAARSPIKALDVEGVLKLLEEEGYVYDAMDI